MFGGVQAGSAFVEISPDLSTFQEKVGAQMAPVTSKFGKLGTAAAAGFVAGIAGAGLVGKALYDIGAQFDDAFDSIQTSTGATGQKLEGLKDNFKTVVSSVPADFGDAADAIGQLNQRLGVTGKPLERIAKQMLELSRITDTDLGENIKEVTRVFGDWGVKVKDQPSALDKLFRASQKTGISVADLGAQMVRYGAPLRQMGFGFSEAAAMVGKFEKEGVNAQLVMGSLRIALGKMASEGIKDPSKALDTLTQQIKNAGSAGEANRLAIETFGARAGPDMAAAIREGRFEFGSLVKAIDRGKGTIMGTGKATRDFGEWWTILKNRVFVLLEPIATRVFSAIGKGLREVTQLMRGKGNLHETLTQVVKDIKPLIDILGYLWDTAKVVLSGLWQSFKGAFDVIRGIVLVVTGLLKGDWDQMWRGIKTIFFGAVDVIKGHLKSTIAPFRAVAAKIGNAIADGFNTVKKLPGKVWDAMKKVLSAIGGFFSSLYNKGKDAASKLIDGVVSFLRNLPSKFLNALASIGSSIANAIKEAAKGAINWIIDKWNSLEFSVDLPGPAPKITVGTPNIPRLASGTRYWKGGPAVVGERGPELMDLPRGTSVTGASATHRILADMGGGSRGVDEVNFFVETVGDGNPDTGHLMAVAGQRLRALGV